MLQLDRPAESAAGASAQRLRELTFLAAMVRAIATSQDHDAVMRSVIEQTTGATNTQVCSLYLWDEDTQRLVLTATNGLAPEAVGVVQLALGEGITAGSARRCSRSSSPTCARIPASSGSPTSTTAASPRCSPYRSWSATGCWAC